MTTPDGLEPLVTELGGWLGQQMRRGVPPIAPARALAIAIGVAVVPLAQSIHPDNRKEIARLLRRAADAWEAGEPTNPFQARSLQ